MRLESASRLNVEESKRDLDRARAMRDRSVVVSPIAGTVLKILARPGEKVSAGIAQIGAIDEMTAVAEVHANDVHLVEVGQAASFTSPALPGPVTGKVSNIGAIIAKNSVFGEDPSAPDNARVFEVTVTLDDSRIAGRFTNLEGQIRISLLNGR